MGVKQDELLLFYVIANYNGSLELAKCRTGHDNHTHYTIRHFGLM